LTSRICEKNEDVKKGERQKALRRPQPTRKRPGVECRCHRCGHRYHRNVEGRAACLPGKTIATLAGCASPLVPRALCTRTKKPPSPWAGLNSPMPGGRATIVATTFAAGLPDCPNRASGPPGRRPGSPYRKRMKSFRSRYGVPSSHTPFAPDRA